MLTRLADHFFTFARPKSMSVQGRNLCFSHQAGLQFFNAAHHEIEVAHCDSFPETIEYLKDDIVEIAVIPVVNNSAGCVPYNHKLIIDSGLHIVGEIFTPIEQCIAGLEGATIDDVLYVNSHPHAFDQCGQIIAKHQFKKIARNDTAGSAELVKEMGLREHAAICPRKAAEVNGLDILIPNAQDDDMNTTQFVALAKKALKYPYIHGTPGANNFITSYAFQLGEAGPNIRLLDKIANAFIGKQLRCSEPEKFLNAKFAPAACYIDVRGHKDSRRHKDAIESLMKNKYILNEEPKVIGYYPRDPFRDVINYV